LTTDVAGRIAEWLADLAGAALAGVPDPRPVGVGWATVDLDRAAADLSALLPGGPVFEPADDDRLLGARCRLTRGPLAPARGQLIVVLLEPATEGRLAAALARHGEGQAAGWFAVPHAAAVVGLSQPEPGPLGPARLVLGGSRFGPYTLILPG
jgi:hypothetical protein